MKFCSKIILGLAVIHDDFNCCFLREIQVSTNALKWHMSDMDVDLD